MAGMKTTCEKPSARVRRAVAESGLSNRALCLAAGLDQATLSRFMAGTRGISLATLDVLADVLGLELVAQRTGRKPREGR